MAHEPFAGISTLAAALAQGRVSSAEATDHYLARIAAGAALNAYVTVDSDGARAQAAASDRRRAAGRARSPLDGVPLALKDNLCTAGLRTTCCSRILENFVPPYDATVVARLRAAGAVLLGKTNLDEFAMGSSTEHSCFGPTRNPWDPARAPGGSSGGSAAAAAAGLCAGALGSDTGGSIRQPAALCGLVGLKPTYGRVSRYGLVAFGSSLDQIGPLTRTVADCALLLHAIAGPDPRDATSVPRPVPDYAAELTIDLSGVTLGVPREYFAAGLDPEVERAVRAAIDWYAAQGARLREVSLPSTPYGVATYYVVATAEASSNLARYDGVHYGVRRGGNERRELYVATRSYGFGAEVRRRIMLGTFCLSSGYYDAYYARGLKTRTVIRRELEAVLADCDALIGPTSPTAAFLLGEKLDDPLAMYLCDVYTVAAPLSGLPALSLPCGFTAAGLPIGLHLLGRAFDEPRLLALAGAFEQAHDFARAALTPAAR